MRRMARSRRAMASFSNSEDRLADAPGGSIEARKAMRRIPGLAVAISIGKWPIACGGANKKGMAKSKKPACAEREPHVFFRGKGRREPFCKKLPGNPDGWGFEARLVFESRPNGNSESLSELDEVQVTGFNHPAKNIHVDFVVLVHGDVSEPRYSAKGF